MKIRHSAFAIGALLIAMYGCKTAPEESDESTRELATIAVVDEGELNIPVVDYEGLRPVLEMEDNKTYVINFWATWCAPCIKELPYFEEVNRQLRGEGVEVILINLDMPRMWDSHLVPFMNKKQLESRIIILDDPNENSWIPKINEGWSGAIPATLIYNNETREFYEKPFTKDELFSTVSTFINKEE